MSSDLATNTPTLDEYHPQFCSSEADIVLRSLEGTLYRVPSFVLRSASGFWNALLSISSQTPASSSSPLPTSQHNNILEPMLRLMSGLPIPSWTPDPESADSDEECISEIENLLLLAESWDAPGPLSFLRFGITAPMFLEQPLRLYALATHFGWVPEAKVASKHSLGLNLYDDEHEEVLKRLSAKDLLILLRLHRARRDQMKVFLDDQDVFTLGNSESSRCVACNHEVDNSAWRELKARIFQEMDRCSKGDFVGSWEMEEWKETDRCWKVKCGKCAALLYHKGQTIRKMKEGLSILPDTV
ncbi:MAG: hypothetical protein NXY57DRAFT_985197 [Lentinula lateritia]|uniref:BTB domain-containing protein n=1 Tax=Lentinula lateritia TaxID=40482 RepID=A0ABQ8VP70_9AGAR|nr:MAG: hypothetical protein NXY57DRAFT_985197 [Lentinula lateritia]KAJ4498157.1 hypothetical protein C8R41DRAFT_819500 [Lentinula lateritia]